MTRPVSPDKPVLPARADDAETRAFIAGWNALAPDRPAGEALKACPLPWCCGEAETVDFGSPQARGEHGFAVNCLSPKCMCITPIYGTEADAIAAWNTRTPHPPLLDEEVVARLAKAIQNVRDEIGASESQKIAFAYAEAAMRSEFSRLKGRGTD